MSSPARCCLGSMLRVRGPSDRTYSGGLRWARRASFEASNRGREHHVVRSVPPGIYAPSHRPITIDPRLLDGSQNQVIADFKSATSDENILSIRPDFGKEGRKVTLRTNYFPMTIPNGPFYQYEIQYPPDSSSKWLRRRILELAEGTPTWQVHLAGLVAHDHAERLVSSTLLPQPLSIDVPFYYEDEEQTADSSHGRRTYNLTIKFDRELETESLKKFIAGDPQYRSYDTTPVISALNLILAAWPTRSGSGGVVAGRNKFFMPGTSSPIRLGSALEAFRGFYSSVRIAHKALMVNVDVCMTPFYKPGNLAVVLLNHVKNTHRFPAFVNGLRVKTTHPGRHNKIQRLSEYTAKTYVFNHAEYGDVSIEEYMFRRYGIQLRHPNLTLVETGGAKVMYLPPELCEILPNQPYGGVLLDEQAAIMIRNTRPPNAVAHAIETEGLEQLGFLQNVPTLKAFGISISPEMATIPGRVIPPPTIKFAGERKCRSFDSGTANWTFRDEQLVKGAKLRNWAVLLIRDGYDSEFGGTSDPHLRKALEEFADTCWELGLKFTSRPTITQFYLPPRNSLDPGREKAVSMIRNVLPDVFAKMPSFVLTVLSSNDNHIYSELKRFFDVTLDIPSVFVMTKVIRFGGPRYIASNVGLKVNVKLGGINHVLDEASMSWLNETPTMLVGVDVTHPGVSSTSETPSIAAVVASVDRDCVHFPANLRIQESKKETVTGLKDMMIERLKAFHAKSNVYPERIIVYRDGVSEGQHGTVVKEELPAIREACKEIDPEYNPKLTIIICVKSHHTKFFPTSDEDTNKNFQLLPGTVVDQGVTPAPGFDFFLQANGNLRHWVRSTYYSVVHDEIGFTADELQALTNNTSYMCSRTTKAVAVAVPAYYADLACERGRCYLHDMLRSTSKSEFVSGEKTWERAVECWGSGPTGDVMKDVMFYL